MVALFALAEAFVVHIHLVRPAHSISLTDCVVLISCSTSDTARQSTRRGRRVSYPLRPPQRVGQDPAPGLVGAASIPPEETADMPNASDLGDDVLSQAIVERGLRSGLVVRCPFQT